MHKFRLIFYIKRVCEIRQIVFWDRIKGSDRHAVSIQEFREKAFTAFLNYPRINHKYLLNQIHITKITGFKEPDQNHLD
jgi:hypothetical protein